MTTTPATPPGTAEPAAARAGGPFTRRYGAGPTHLLVLLGCFALTLAAALHVRHDPLRLRYAAWFLGAALAHDLILFPAYALADKALHPRRTRPSGTRPHRDPGTVNYLRVPALLSGLLLLLFAPVILRRSEPAYAAASDLNQQPYLTHWLLLTTALFLSSALIYLLRHRRARPA